MIFFYVQAENRPSKRRQDGSLDKSLYSPVKISGTWGLQNATVAPRHITPHPQLSVKIIILFAFHTYRLIKSKFQNHVKSIYLSDIYEWIIHQFSHVGFVLKHKWLCYHGGLETVDPQAYWQWELSQQKGHPRQMFVNCWPTSQTLAYHENWLLIGSMSRFSSIL